MPIPEYILERLAVQRDLPTHRIRRGKLVEIPEKWRGQVTSHQTIKKRQSKHSRKRRRFVGKQSMHGGPHIYPGSRTHERRAAIKEGEEE